MISKEISRKVVLLDARMARARGSCGSSLSSYLAYPCIHPVSRLSFEFQDLDCWNLVMEEGGIFPHAYGPTCVA